MRSLTSKVNSKTSNQATVTKTNYWLNVKSSVSNVGINLAQGIKQHDVYIELIKEVGIEALNEYLAENEPHLYIIEEGTSSQPTHIKSLVDKIKSKS